jgi:REP element-mobilizing transposase RayT
MATVVRNLDCPALLINSVEDHVHVLLALSRIVAVSTVVEGAKKASSRWLKSQSPDLRSFSWQVGYGAFAVSKSEVSKVYDYILHQEEHHRRIPFQDEYRATLIEQGVSYDEDHLWD